MAKGRVPVHYDVLGRLSVKLPKINRLSPVIQVPERGGRFAREQERIRALLHLLRGGILKERPFDALFEAEREIVRAQAAAFVFWRQNRAELRF